ncbi:MAG: ribonucleoside triphosphate reductase [Lachnospiraceae bacterium]|jgi:ribonucleoside-triphosphate reductase|uniref:Ribonucleoside triphosphate reductase n=1 Tax=Hominisplanchenecus murintestinalis TaxID=2941517 RepID=A0AC61R170_9FIRM|nr:ribonucleoside triphosphate reductase [Hominisplanchenecus murintestinalis]MCI9515612.1 ribonucleoside triphosphate reductase [Lachnospiraceae bacterium]RKK00932.1 ribonucleoside triphosphate reductase [Anaerotruncus sp. 1XD22-93]MCI9660132.1 ribonucleoside triphosphate reductase [Lachnospiraceae bacterium]NBH96814.1 ribonucleoside triphosphate reductase [Lachnospiraceae bacterium]NBI73973.1 ribonucleoside triphosphate reductase [Lachnospiraceae bacterium]
MFKVVKRDGEVAEFNLEKISDAIAKAFDATEKQYNGDMTGLLALRVTADFQPKIKNELIDVESIQDSVEEVLVQTGYADVAKAYILYRKQREKIRNMKSTILDYKEIVNSYVKVEDWRVKENSTVTYSVGGLILSNSGAVTANYWLSEIYDEEIADAHRNADIHIHDLSMLTGYCAGWSLKQLITEGLGGIEGKITSAPAKHLSVLCNQMVNFLGIMQNEWAGAQAFSSFDTYLAPFVKADNLSYQEVKKCIESFIYGVNTPSRWGTQAPFSNITLDWTVPDDLAELPAIVGGKPMDFCYKDCKKEMDMVNRAFIETMIEGDANGRGFQYPIPTYSITQDFDWSDTENNRLLFEMTSKYGTPYFSNYINSDMEPSDVRSMCCRLRLDLRELRKKTGGFFGSGESTGSVGVVTVNLPRIAYLSKNEKEFYKRLDHMMDISARSLKIKRDVVSKLLDEGLYPYTKRYLGSFDSHFSTIGLIGMNEVGLNAVWLRKDLTHAETQTFAKEVLNHMRERLVMYQEEYGDLYNLEATPAESTTYRLAKHDRQRWADIRTAGREGDTPYYTNSSHLPVEFTSDIFDALDIQDELQTLYTSGTVFHAFLGEKLPDWKAAANLVRKIAENYKLPYYTLSPTYSVCKKHGYITGEHFTCPTCGETAEVYSRITGYYRPVQNWNDGKAQEYNNRQLYDIGNSCLKKVHSSIVTVSKEDVKIEPVESKKYLFTTKTCPNCQIAKEMLKGEPCRVIDAEENQELAMKYGIMQAPTLVVVDGHQAKKYVNASNIKKYVDASRRR